MIDSLANLYQYNIIDTYTKEKSVCFYSKKRLYSNNFDFAPELISSDGCIFRYPVAAWRIKKTEKKNLFCRLFKKSEPIVVHYMLEEYWGKRIPII